jgi:hypothetical protein
MKTFFIFTAITVCSMLLYGQEVLATGGGFHQNSSASISFTIGEPVIETFQTPDNTLTQGFQQTKLIVTGIDMVESTDFSLNVFPNPTQNNLNIHVTSEKPLQLQVQLFNINGALLFEEKHKQNPVQLDMKFLPPGNYLLRVSDENLHTNTYKIVKK